MQKRVPDINRKITLKRGKYILIDFDNKSKTFHNFRNLIMNF